MLELPERGIIMDRSTRAQLARETLAILRRGRYSTPNGSTVHIREEQRAAELNTILYTPEALADLQLELSPGARRATQFQVTNEDTLTAARRLDGQKKPTRVVCLNFASAKHPGGGFLRGSAAQEESLARSSGLYPCLRRAADYYNRNRACGTALYTDHVIYSPDVPVFRSAAGALLSDPFLASFITAPAVNARVVRKKEPANIPRILPVMEQRAEYVLKVAHYHQHTHVVLGAWGCGVFRNEPAEIAAIFRSLLRGSGVFSGIFAVVLFAVLDGTDRQKTLRTFQQVLGGPPG